MKYRHRKIAFYSESNQHHEQNVLDDHIFTSETTSCADFHCVFGVFVSVG
jgi:hypothetical protein